jgi:hypothetical protein
MFVAVILKSQILQLSRYGLTLRVKPRYLMDWQYPIASALRTLFPVEPGSSNQALLTLEAAFSDPRRLGALGEHFVSGLVSYDKVQIPSS